MGMNYEPVVHFDVIRKKDGTKVCECGEERDALELVAIRPDELTYVRSDRHLMGPVVDVTPPPALPTTDVVPVPRKAPEPPKQLESKPLKLEQDTREAFRA